MKTPKPEKGRHQHRKPPCYNDQITNLTTIQKQALQYKNKPKQVAKKNCTNNQTTHLYRWTTQ